VTVCNSQKSQILNGPRDLDTGLWRINLKQTNNHIPEPIANNLYELSNTGALVYYLHKALFSPTKSAMLQAVKDGNLITWPGLTEDDIHKNLKLTPATAMGHMNQRRQNIRSTPKTPIADAPTADTNIGTKTHLVYAVLVDQGQLYTDLTGKFPVRSSKGNSYVMVCYVYDCNYVEFIPMKSLSASEWVKAYDTIHQEITVKGFKPKLQTLDNEASAALKIFSPPMMWSTNWFRLTAISAIPLNAPSELLKHLSIVLVGKTLTADGNYIEFPADLETPPTIIRRSSLSWSRGLQKNRFCSVRMQNYCTQETRKATHFVAPRATCLFLGSRNASLPMSKCIHLFHS
jgi:hypothetical protein